MSRFIDLLPIIIMCESFAASVPLAIYDRWGSALYWFCAGGIGYAVIFMIKRFG